MLTHKNSDYKLSAIKYYLSHSKNRVQTCKIFGCSERSLMRWVDKYKSTNNITRKKRDYKAYKISNSHISFIKQQLNQNYTTVTTPLINFFFKQMAEQNTVPNALKILKKKLIYSYFFYTIEEFYIIIY